MMHAHMTNSCGADLDCVPHHFWPNPNVSLVAHGQMVKDIPMEQCLSLLSLAAGERGSTRSLMLILAFLLWSFSRQQDMMPRGHGDGHSRAGESITAGNGSNDLSRSFSMSSSDDTNSNIMFSVPGSKKAKVLRAGRQEGQGAHRRRRRHGHQLQQNRIPVWPVEHVSVHARHGRLPAAAGLCRLRSPRQAWLRHSPAKHR